MFHALSRENIRAIVQIQLERVVRTAAAQDITVKPDDELVDHLVEVGYQPEFGARELRRQIRQSVETGLAKEILGDKLKSGDSVELGYDKASEAVVFRKMEAVKKPKAGKAAAKGAAPRKADSTVAAGDSSA
ncbi:Chaperone protein ClpB 1 [compost metagenome]